MSRTLFIQFYRGYDGQRLLGSFFYLFFYFFIFYSYKLSVALNATVSGWLLWIHQEDPEDILGYFVHA